MSRRVKASLRISSGTLNREGVFGINPSREIGIIKNAIKEAILDGEIPNEFQAAYDFMLKKGNELGLNQVNDLEPPPSGSST